MPDVSKRQTEPARRRKRSLGSWPDDVVEQLARSRDPHDFELNSADAQSGSGCGWHLAVRNGDVTARRLPGNRTPERFGRAAQVLVRLHGDMAMPGAVVAVTDEAATRLSLYRIDISHRKSRAGSYVKTGHYRGLCHVQLRSCIAS